jgi:neutral amino acid transport system substrate-binding protein
VKGCQVDFILRDDTSQPSVGLDAARFLVDVQKVAAIVGIVGSGTALQIVNSVSVPKQVPTVACCAVTPALTRLAEEGKTGGYFFRTIPTSRSMALAHAKAAVDLGYKNTVILYINNDFGAGTAPDARLALEKLGGKVAGMVGYAENQPSYRAEVTRALALNPDSMILIGLSQDGTVLLREWFSLGGTQNVILHNTMRSMDVIKGVGEKFLGKAVGVDNGQASGPSSEAFNKAFQEAYGRPAVGPRRPSRCSRCRPRPGSRATPSATHCARCRTRPASRCSPAPRGSSRASRRSRPDARSATSARPAPSASTATATSPGRCSSGSSPAGRSSPSA